MNPYKILWSCCVWISLSSIYLRSNFDYEKI